MTVIDAFNNIPASPLAPINDVRGSDVLENVAKMQVGFGDKAFKSDESGIWLGANKFASAPFRVDMDGNMVASSATFGQYLTKAGANQVVTGQLIVGGSDNGIIYVKDSSNNTRITMDEDGFLWNDGTDDRILIGDE